MLFPFAALSQQSSMESAPASPAPTQVQQTPAPTSLFSLSLSKRHPGLPLKPPTTPGCYTFTPSAANAAGGQWEQAPCLSPEEARRLPRPLQGGDVVGLPGIQSQRAPIHFREFPKKVAGWGLFGFEQASITVMLAQGSLAGETDSKTSTQAFSIQLNTNGFNAACHGSNPLPAGATASPCIPNDEVGVQFMYQTHDFGTSTDALCIWNVDISKQYYYLPETWQSCASVPAATAGWTPGQSVTLVASVDPATHTISLTGSFPWTPKTVTVTAPDWFGLCWTAGGVLSGECSWDEAVGGILGYGDESTANFGPIGIQTTISTQQQPVFASPEYLEASGNSIYLSHTSGTSNAPGSYRAHTMEQNNLSLWYSVGLPKTSCSGAICTFFYAATNVHP
jgi:hypothetical protein